MTPEQTFYIGLGIIIGWIVKTLWAKIARRMIKRYMLFQWEGDAEGGLNDYVGSYDTVEQAQSAFNPETYQSGDNLASSTYGEIWDSHTITKSLMWGGVYYSKGKPHRIMVWRTPQEDWGDTGP